MSGERSRRVPWLHRLSVRLAMVVAAALILFELSSSFLVEAVFDALGLPGSGVAVKVDEEPIAFGEGSHAGMLESPWDLADRLLEDAIVDGAGAWHPSDEAIAAVNAGLPGEESFLWTDQNLFVLAAGTEVESRLGTLWDPETFPEDLPLDPFPLYREGALAGWFVLTGHIHDHDHIDYLSWDLGEEIPDIHDAGVTILDPEEFARTERRMELTVAALSWTISGFVALLLGAVVSRLVTRRLSKLARTAADAPLGAEELPGPFESGGRDEIALLAEALNESRTRVAELVGALDERDVQRREWIAQVSHDLRTPLTALIACLERAKRTVARVGSDEERAELGSTLKVAFQDAERVRVLAEDLLDIARLDAKGSLHLEPVLPGELVSNVVENLRPIGEEHGVEVRGVTSGVGRSLTADGRLLLRVLENLVRNALRHARGLVEVSEEPDANGVRFVVRDDGSGFPGSLGHIDLERMVNGGAPDDSLGSGLGLTVALRIVHSHGGVLEAENIPSGGARVSFHLPIHERH